MPLRDSKGNYTASSAEFEDEMQQIINRKFQEGLELGISPEELMYSFTVCSQRAVSKYYSAKQIQKHKQKPSLAYFWFVNEDDFVGTTSSFQDGEISKGGGYVTCRFDHDTFMRAYPHEYAWVYKEGVPGYVRFDNIWGRYQVVGPERLLMNEKFRRKVIEKYNLPEDVTFVIEEL